MERDQAERLIEQMALTRRVIGSVNLTLALMLLVVALGVAAQLWGLR